MGGAPDSERVEGRDGETIECQRFDLSKRLVMNVGEHRWGGNPQLLAGDGRGSLGVSWNDPGENYEIRSPRLSEPGYQSEDRRSSRSANWALLNDCCRHRACHLLLTSEQADKDASFSASRLMTASTSS